MIKNKVFRAQLDNGHSFVAYAKNKCGVECGELHEEDMVKVQMSPYDMSKGLILEKLGKEGCCNES